MRYQENIYIQNNNSGLRNRDNVNVNMSSDMSVFSAPKFEVIGASKLDCTGTTTGTSYVITTETTIPLTFDFTANTSSFSAVSANFKYEIYKYSNPINGFIDSPIYKSDIIEYSGFSGSNQTIQNIPISGISMDGDYLVKGYYEFANQTDFLNKLGKRVDTSIFKGGSEYGLYNSELDYYFIAIAKPDEPIFVINNSNTLPSNKLQQQVILPELINPVYDDNGDLVISKTQGYTIFPIASNYVGDFIVTLNGLVLANDVDYSFSGNLVTLNSEIYYDDTVTVIYTTADSTNLVCDNIFITTNILSGATNGEGSNYYYYNTDTSKYEIYTKVSPNNGDTIIVMINGVTLANNIDYYQSITNSKRIILEGDLIKDDVITIAYFPNASVAFGLTISNPFISWAINTPPQMVNGNFNLEVSSDTGFSSITYSASTDYIVGTTAYGLGITITGPIGTELYYRVKNEKNYVTICGNIINTVTYSETIPITIQSNSINSY